MGFLVLLAECLVGLAGLWCVGRVFPPTKPYVKKMNKKIVGKLKGEARRRHRLRKAARQSQKRAQARQVGRAPVKAPRAPRKVAAAPAGRRRTATATATLPPGYKRRANEMRGQMIPVQPRGDQRGLRSVGLCGAPTQKDKGHCMNRKAAGKGSCWIPSHAAKTGAKK